MTITLRYFGILADITQKKEEVFHFKHETISLNLLQSKIEEHYPGIKKISYSLAINQSITKENVSLNDNDEIALLPAFAGG
jgi:molybdopterin synthase sulfur carrier subunit